MMTQPDPKPGISRPTTFPAVCGYPLSPGRRAAWSVSGRNRWGRPLQDAEGQTVGLLLGTDVYVLFDLLGQELPIACLLQEWVQRLLAQREFAAATEVLLQYLRTVNPADWRKAVTVWTETSP